MVRLSKKAITAISITSAAIIAGGTITAAVLIKNNNSKNKEEEKNTNPLKRDRSYHHYTILNKIKSNEKLSELITLEKVENSFFYIIDESKFVSKIKTIIQEAFKSISAFSTNWNNYKIVVNYNVENIGKIKLDVVWFLPNTKIKYFDQFELLLQVT